MFSRIEVKNLIMQTPGFSGSQQEYKGFFKIKSKSEQTILWSFYSEVKWNVFHNHKF